VELCLVWLLDVAHFISLDLTKPKKSRVKTKSKSRNENADYKTKNKKPKNGDFLFCLFLGVYFFRKKNINEPARTLKTPNPNPQ
jgi:hypothetical protein